MYAFFPNLITGPLPEICNTTNVERLQKTANVTRFSMTFNNVYHTDKAAFCFTLNGVRTVSQLKILTQLNIFICQGKKICHVT